MRVRLSTLACLGFWLAGETTPVFGLDSQKALTQYTRREWTQSEGLPQETIRTIRQTDDGYLWLGTGEGVARFDGKEFVTFSKNDGIPGNSIIGIAVSGGTGLWLGTNEGLARYRDGRFETVSSDSGLPPGRPVTSVHEDTEGVAWVVSGGALWKIEQDKAQQIPMSDLAPIESVRIVFNDSQDRLWVAGVNGVVRREDGRFVPVAGPEILGGRVITTLAVRSGELWMGGNDRGLIQMLSDGSHRIYTTRDGLPNDLVLELLEDRAGNIWAGTYAGLSRFKNGRFEGPLVNRQGGSEWVWSLFEDREGNLWVGASDRLVQLRDDLFTIHGRPEGLPSDQPIATFEDPDGVLWIGFRDKGLVAWPNASLDSGLGKFKHYTTRDGLPSDEIFTIRGCSHGGLLIATNNGFARFLNGRFLNTIVPDPAGRRAVHDAMEDSKGRIWAATPSGVYRLDPNGPQPGQWEPVISSGLNPISYATVLSEGPDGSIWAGTFSNGLWKVDDPKHPGAPPVHYTTADGLGSHQISSIEWDADGTLWVAAMDGGIAGLWNGRWRGVSANTGLASDNISHIDDDGSNLWLSSTRGVARVAKWQIHDLWAGKIERVTPVNFGPADGLRTWQAAPIFPSGGGGTRTRDGRLWFTTGNGLAVYDSRATVPFRLSESAPMPVHVLDMLVDGDGIDLGSSANLPPGSGRVEFRYVGIHLSAPETVRYSYRLDGIDTEWIRAGDRRSASYNRLPHGSYRFRVRAELPGGSTSDTSYAFAVLPHFYETKTFLIGTLLGLMAAIYAGYQLRMAQIRGRYEAVFQERARLAREIHDTLAQGFVGIAHQLDALASRLDGDPDVAQQHLTLARRMTRHSLTEARRSMMDLRMTELQDQCLSKALASAAPRWVAGTPVSIHTEIGENNSQVSKDLEQNVFRIAQEAVSNVVKHAQARTVSLELAVAGSRLRLSIRDDGRGFEASRSYTGVDGHFGIVGMRERAERFGGKFTLASQPGSGTQVKVEIPLESNAIHE